MEGTRLPRDLKQEDLSERIYAPTIRALRGMVCVCDHRWKMDHVRQTTAEEDRVGVQERDVCLVGERSSISD